ncbi:MAG: enolase C-terminal domain-like protein, partial [Woeseiaceae bacterium]|nr:enolase C-terminal domain-like protein [Woeseiaceae bacterium]
MRVRSYQCVERSLALVEGYRIAGHAIDSATNFIVRIETDSGIVGHGCAAPAEEVTGESDALCHEVLDGVLRHHVEKATLDDDPSDLTLKLLALAPGAPAACAAVDIALWDIAAQAAGKPLAELFGSLRPPMPTSVTIGICDVGQTLVEADGWLQKGFTVLKIKTGEDVDNDIDRLRQLRMRCGKDVELRVDANRGYTLA